MTRTVVQFRCSPQEKSEIEARAERAGLRMSEYVRRLALGLVPVAPPPRAAERSSRPKGHSRAGPSSTIASAPGGSADDGSGRGERLARARAVKAEAEEASPAPERRYRCPRDCDPNWRPLVPIRCRVCNRAAVPA